MPPAPHRLVVLSGPSCVGKSPLCRALGRFFPDLRARLQPLVLYNSRAPRPGEIDAVDYHFRTRAQIAELGRERRYAVMDVRGDLQALDLDELGRQLDASDVLFEGNPFVGRALIGHGGLGAVPKLSAFLAPLTRAEILFLRAPERNVSLPALVTDLMRRKLLRRTRRQRGELSLADLENVERRAGSAYAELQLACHFQHVVPNHDGEDSDNWDAFYYPLGDARRALLAFAALLRDEAAPDGVEQWEPGLPE